MFLRCYACNEPIEVADGELGRVACPKCGAKRDVPTLATDGSRPRRTSRLAILSLLTGLVGLPLVPSLLGSLALSDIREGEGALRGRGLARLGIVLGLLWFLVAGAAVYTAAVPEQVVPRLRPEEIARNHDSAARALLTLAAQQANFKDADHDRNEVRDFWVADVAGLYFFPMKLSGHPELVLLDLARADAMPVADHQDFYEPRDGYAFQAVPGVDRRVEFAFTAIPDRYGWDGLLTFYVDERRDVWEKDLRGLPADRHLADPEKEGWRRKY